MESPPALLDERALVEKARADGDAFAELYRAYLPRIHAFAYRRCGSAEAAEDITAATFEQALRRMGEFRWSGGGFGPWLFAIAANAAIDHHRADHRARGRRHHRGLGTLAPAVADWPGDDHGDDTVALRRALATLRPRYQQAISLRYLAGLSHEDAAAAMGATKAVMAVTLHRAMAALRRALEHHQEVGT